MKAHITQLYYYDRADYALCGFIRKLRQKYGPLDPDVNEDYRNWLIEQGKLPPDYQPRSPEVTPCG
ncbi:MAG: hypothetical protein IIU00_06435 [Clostridia bacterium]|nr:hypothetical protein [Clostridia bacterium]